MALLLTSAGLPNQKLRNLLVANLTKPPNTCLVLMMAYARSQEEHDYVGGLKHELAQTGIRNIDLFNLQENRLGDRTKYDVIYVCGGNTFSILNRMRIAGADEFIKNAMKNQDILYVGVSAGSIIAGPNIAIAGWGSEGDKNEIGLEDLTGLGLTEISIFPHFKAYLKPEVEEFRTIAHYPVIELTDEQAVFINDEDHQVIGE